MKQLVTPQVNEACAALLAELSRLQERAHLKDPVKSAMRKRYVLSPLSVNSSPLESSQRCASDMHPDPSSLNPGPNRSLSCGQHGCPQHVCGVREVLRLRPSAPLLPVNQVRVRAARGAALPQDE